jgi:hypothetical protein
MRPPQFSETALQAASSTDMVGKNALAVVAPRGGYEDQLEKQRDLFGFLHGFARPGT